MDTWILILTILAFLVFFFGVQMSYRSLPARSVGCVPAEVPVGLGASAPQTVGSGSAFTARFVAYAEDLEDDVEIMLQRLSPRSQSHMRIKRCTWRIGTTVRVRLSGDHLVVNPPEEEFIWGGECDLVDFDVVAGEVPGAITVLKFDVSIDQIVVARLRLELEINSLPTSPTRRLVQSEAARTAFASYASEDRLRVLDRLSEIGRNGVDVFVDCLSLNPGDEWKPKLELEIKQRELFLLFWSTYAKKSECVTWEWRTALLYKGLSGIDPHPLEPVFQAEPPEELKALHFGDPYMLARKAFEDHG